MVRLSLGVIEIMSKWLDALFPLLGLELRCFNYDLWVSSHEKWYSFFPSAGLHKTAAIVVKSSILPSLIVLGAELGIFLISSNASLNRHLWLWAENKLIWFYLVSWD